MSGYYSDKLLDSLRSKSLDWIVLSVSYFDKESSEEVISEVWVDNSD